MNSPFAEITKVEKAKDDLRASVELLARSAIRNGNESVVAAWLVTMAAQTPDGIRFKGPRKGSSGYARALAVFGRMKDGEFATEADILREFGDHHTSRSSLRPDEANEVYRKLLISIEH